MIKSLAKKIDSVTAAAFLVASFSLLSRLLGMVRDRVLAGQFGAGDNLDVYYAAFRIPDLLFNLLVLGALSAGFIPVFAQLIDDEDKINQEANRLISLIINLLILFLVAVGILGIIFAPWLIKLMTPGFSPEKLALTVQMSRVMFLSPLMLGLSSILGGVLQSYKRFLIDALSPIFYNLGIICGALFLVPHYGVYALAWGVVAGSFMHMIVQVPTLLKMGWRWQPVLDWRDKHVASILKMTTARTMSLAINQINLLVITAIASTVSGSLSIFNLANNLQSFPIGIFGISFAIAVFPTMAANAFKRKKLIAQFSKTFRYIMFFMVPATGMFLVLRAEIVRVALGSGAFGWDDTQRTMDAMAMFAFSFFAQAAIPLLIRVFYARHNSKTPFYVGLVSVVVNIVCARWLVVVFGVSGLALAFSVSSVVNFIILWLVLREELGGLDERKIIKAMSKFSLAALVAVFAAQATKMSVGSVVDMQSFLGVALKGAAATIVGLVVYLGICWLLKSEEFMSFKNNLRRRLPQAKAVADDQSEAGGV